jgi:hypothetical protein
MASFPADVGEIPLYRGDSRTLTFTFKDADAAAIDLSAYGSVVTAQARKTADGTVLLTLDTSGSNLAGGIVAVGISPDDWEPIEATFSKGGKLGFDVQADADGSRVTTVVKGTFKVTADYTHEDAS